MHIPVLRSLIVSLVLVGLLLVVIATLTGLLVVLALVVGLAVLNVVYLPRAAKRLRLPVRWLALMLIPFMTLAGVVVDGVEGAGWGAGVWLLAIGLPRAIGRDLIRRTRRRIEARLGYYDVQPRSATADQPRKPTGDRGGRPLPPADDRGRGGYGP
jgi:4-hydroxybenzoate polyprenyltransferase